MCNSTVNLSSYRQASSSNVNPDRPGTIEVYDISSKQLRSFPIAYTHKIGGVNDLDWSADGRSLLLAAYESDGGYETYKTFMRLDLASSIVTNYNIPDIQPANLYRVRALGEH